MGLRGEVFSVRLSKRDCTWFFNVKENVYGELFLNIAQSRPTEREGHFQRQAIVVYQEKLPAFYKTLEDKFTWMKEHAKTGRPADTSDPRELSGGKKPRRPRPGRSNEAESVVGRAYSFDIVADEWGDLRLEITEIKNSADLTFNLRQTITVWQEDIGEFFQRFQAAVDFITQHAQAGRKSAEAPQKAPAAPRRKILIRRKKTVQTPAAEGEDAPSEE